MNSKEQFKYWRKRILITVWLTYSTFYLCRVNMSIAIPGIIGDFGYSKAVMGGVLTALFVTYAAGQFVSGQLGDKLGARRLVTLGIFGSATLNVAFGFSTGITMMIVIWGFNGIFQSMGWAPSVKTIANWFPQRARGKVGGILGTSYIIGNAYSWALAGLVAGLLGWRWCFWVPAIIFMISGIHWYIRSRNAPEEVGLHTIEEEARKVKPRQITKKDFHLGFHHTVMLCLKHPAVWCVAFGLLFLNIVRYGFVGWIPLFMFEVQGVAISSAALAAMVIPIAGSLGAISAGWISDRFFQSRRAPIAVVMLAILAAFVFVFSYVSAESLILGVACLPIIGFMTYGPHVLMVGIMPMDIGTRKAAASVTGFIDGFGYIGAALSGICSGLLIDLYGWYAVFYFWAISVLIATVLMAALWTRRTPQGKYQ